MELNRRQFIVLSGAALATLAVPLRVLARESKAVPVLLYHDISNQHHDPYTISPSLFAAQLEWLYEAGYRAVTIGEACAAPSGEHDRLVALTFDDGYASFVNYALPLCHAYGFSATIAVIGNLVGRFMEREGRRPMLSWDEYRYLVADGTVEVACHTFALHSMAALSSPTTAGLAADLSLFQQTVERELGKKAAVLAWPYGIYRPEWVEVARRAGFSYLLTSNEDLLSGNNDCSAVPRLAIGNKLDLISFQQYLGGH